MLKWHSQYGQDTYVYNRFCSPDGYPNKNGVFVDIGAYDGVTLSNSYVLENLGWTGWCFEPMPERYMQLVQARPNSQCHNCAIGRDNKMVEFCHVDGEPDMLSGVAEYYSAEHSLRINKEAQETHSAVKWIDVQMKTLDSFIEPNTHIDYLSLDTEGGEAGILQNILLNFSPTIITVEANYPEDVRNIMDIVDRKYSYVQNIGCDMVLVLK